MRVPPPAVLVHTPLLCKPHAFARVVRTGSRTQGLAGVSYGSAARRTQPWAIDRLVGHTTSSPVACCPAASWRHPPVSQSVSLPGRDHDASARPIQVPAPRSPHSPPWRDVLDGAEGASQDGGSAGDHAAHRHADRHAPGADARHAGVPATPRPPAPAGRTRGQQGPRRRRHLQWMRATDASETRRVLPPARCSRRAPTRGSGLVVARAGQHRQRCWPVRVMDGRDGWRIRMHAAAHVTGWRVTRGL